MKFHAVVDAEQWQPGKSVAGVRTREGLVRYDRAGKLYYVEKGHLRSTMWLSVEKFPGEVTEERKKSAGFLSGAWVQFRIKSTGEVYHRAGFSFMEFEIKSGREEQLDETSDMFMDYASVEKWDHDCIGPARIGWLDRPEGRADKVSPGDWIVTDTAGVRRVVSDEVFRATHAEAPA